MRHAAARIGLVWVAALSVAFSTPASAFEPANIESQTSSSADEQAREALLSWMLSEEEWSSLPSFDGEPIKITLRKTFPRTLSDREIEELGELVRNHPGHPRRRDLDDAVARAKGYHDQEITIVLTGDGRAYRYHERKSRPGAHVVPSLDATLSPKGSGNGDWSLVERADSELSLHRFAPDTQPSQAFGPRPVGFTNLIKKDLWYTVAGRGVTPRSLVDSIERVSGSVDSGRITLRVTTSVRGAATVSLKRAANDRWFATEAEFWAPNATEAHPAVRIRFSPPVWDDALDRYVVPMYTTLDAQGRMDTEVSIDGIARLTPEAASSYFEMPKPGGTDAIRGAPLTITDVYDYRQSGTEHTSFDSATQTPGDVTPLVAAQPDAGGSRIRPLGWAVLALLGGILAAVIWKRKS